MVISMQAGHHIIIPIQELIFYDKIIFIILVVIQIDKIIMFLIRKKEMMILKIVWNIYLQNFDYTKYIN